MSDAVASAETHEQAEAGSPPPPPPSTYHLLDRVRWIGYVLLGLQGVGFLVWSVILYEHFSLTLDFASYNQAWFLAAHGNLDPYSTTLRLQWWRNDAEFFPYVLAPLYWIFRSDLVLPLAQDLSVVGAEVVGFTWLCDVVKRHCTGRDAALLAGLGVLLFVATPWLWWSISWDVHMEPMVMFFAMYMAWDLSRGKRRSWVWMVLVLLSGAPDLTSIIGIGLGGVVAGRRSRRMGAAFAAIGIAYLLFLGRIHGDVVGSGALSHYLSLAAHPFSLVQRFWNYRADLIANLAPGGLLGIGAPMIMPVTLMWLVENTLDGNASFIQPAYQSVALYVFLPVGTVAVLAWLLRRHRRAALLLAGAMAVQAVGWAAIWGPRTPGQWLRVSNAEAATLASVAARIPASAEVVASQGVVGYFSARALVHAIYGQGGRLPVKAGTWFVITPTSGIEITSVASSMALIGELAGPLHATLVTHANGVWAFRLNPPPEIRSVIVPNGPSSPLPAWAGEGAVGRPVLDGPVSGWHMAATGAKGYVADGMEWLETPGRYDAYVTLLTTGAVNVEVWNDTGNVLLARRHVLPVGGIQTVSLPVDASVPYRATVYSGWGPFRADFIEPPAGERLEVRVWSPGGTTVNVYNADLTAVPTR